MCYQQVTVMDTAWTLCQVECTSELSTPKEIRRSFFFFFFIRSWSPVVKVLYRVLTFYLIQICVCVSAQQVREVLGHSKKDP